MSVHAAGWKKPLHADVGGSSKPDECVIRLAPYLHRAANVLICGDSGRRRETAETSPTEIRSGSFAFERNWKEINQREFKSMAPAAVKYLRSLFSLSTKSKKKKETEDDCRRQCTLIYECKFFTLSIFYCGNIQPWLFSHLLTLTADKTGVKKNLRRRMKFDRTQEPRGISVL